MKDFLKQLRAIEIKWQKRWQDAKIFEPTIKDEKPKWFLTLPYPYASGPLHIGHCRTYNIGDIYARYKRQRGFNVLWPMAFHITGTPVLSVSTLIKKGDIRIRTLYEEYIGIYEKNPIEIKKILKSFEDPHNVAMYFAGKLIYDFLRMGFSLDTTRQFTTGDKEYNKFIEWQYGILYEKGYITKGNYPILWCTQCKNAVGEDDIQGGDESKIEVNEFVGVKFKISENTYLVAATLRPETIYGVTNIWINPNTIYNKIDFENERWIISENAFEKFKEQNNNTKLIDKFKGIEFIGQQVEIPIVKRSIPIYPADFVDPDHATGVVYSVPAHAPYDYIALKDLQENSKVVEKFNLDKKTLNKMNPISLIEVKGYGEFPAVEICEKLGVKTQTDTELLEEATQEIYKAEFYSGKLKEITNEIAGMSVENAKIAMEQILKENNFAQTVYEVSKKAKCRCGGKIIVAVLSEQYFLNYGNEEWKTQAFTALNKMSIVPKKYRIAFERTFDWLQKRPCVRKRGLGTEFPMTKGKGWIIESLSDSVIYMAFYTIIKIIRRKNITPRQLIPELFDYIFLGKGNLDSVSMKTQIPTEDIYLLKTEFEYWYPNDFRHTAINHISNHLSFAIFHHVAIFPEKYWLRKFSLNDMLIMEGQKMGKSKGNAIPIAYIPRKYSADLTRLHLASLATVDSIIDWRDKEVAYSLKKLKKFWDFAFSVKNVDTMVDKEPLKDKNGNISFYSKIFRSTINSNIYHAITAIENDHIRDYIQYGFFENLREFEKYSNIIEQLGLSEGKFVFRNAIEEVTKLIAPVIPHICEEIYEMFHGEKKGYSFISQKLISITVISEEENQLALKAKFIQNFMDDIDQILHIVEIKPKRIYCYVNPQWKHVLYKEVAHKFQNTAPSVKEIMIFAKNNPELQKFMKKVAKEAQIIVKNPSVFKISILPPDEQISAIISYKKYFNMKYGDIEILIHFADEIDVYDPKNKRFNARPMKPAIFME